MHLPNRRRAAPLAAALVPIRTVDKTLSIVSPAALADGGQPQKNVGGVHGNYLAARGSLPLSSTDPPFDRLADGLWLLANVR